MDIDHVDRFLDRLDEAEDFEDLELDKWEVAFLQSMKRLLYRQQERAEARFQQLVKLIQASAADNAAMESALQELRTTDETLKGIAPTTTDKESST